MARPDDVGSPNTQELLSHELGSNGGGAVSGSGALAFGKVVLNSYPTIGPSLTDNNNGTQLFLTTNISTIAESQQTEIG